MDNVIFEDPSKQHPRQKRPSRVRPIEVMPNQNDPTHSEQQRCVPSQRLFVADLDLGGSGRSPENSINYLDGDKGRQVYGTPNRSDFDPASITASSLFSISEDDRYSVGEGSPGQQDSLFSSPEPEGCTMDSDASVSSIIDKRGEAATSGYLDSFNRKSKGKDQDVTIVLEDDVLGGDAANWVALQNEILESEVGVSTLRIRPSATDREENDVVEPFTESDNSERGDDGDHTIPAQDDRKRMGHIHTTGRASIISHTNGNSSRADAAGVVGGIQQSTLNDSGTNALQTANLTFPSSRKRRRVPLPESPSEVDGSDDQTSYRKKVSLSRSSQSRRCTQNERPLAAIGSRPEFPLSGLVSRSVSCDIPASPGKGQHGVEEGAVWEYRRLLGYRIVKGRPFVLVPWVPTWEPSDEYPEEEVDQVRRKYQARMHGRQRGRPRSKQQV